MVKSAIAVFSLLYSSSSASAFSNVAIFWKSNLPGISHLLGIVHLPETNHYLENIDFLEINNSLKSAISQK